jgi:hypothetical protein
MPDRLVPYVIAAGFAHVMEIDVVPTLSVYAIAALEYGPAPVLLSFAVTVIGKVPEAVAVPERTPLTKVSPAGNAPASV